MPLGKITITPRYARTIQEVRDEYEKRTGEILSDKRIQQIIKAAETKMRTAMMKDLYEETTRRAA